ncbi:putative E3 ubiquitin-protein ligase SINA-like 6 [Triticum aestivum]|uniref:putative E3 ubiquitin-protein ligase SINA-like 6 n=1 Tax=Triticum aestivum TaxID=4565 RepID=UPI001D02AB3D|nr:putative E3 ubiquitin-protein ligase SINA-like 6 [Triticum aestivum]
MASSSSSGYSTGGDGSSGTAASPLDSEPSSGAGVALPGGAATPSSSSSSGLDRSRLLLDPVILFKGGSNSTKRSVEAQLEEQVSAKRQNVSMGMATLDCPVCFKALRPPIFLCSVGHFICSSCRGKQLGNKCQSCSIKTSFQRCFGMEHVVQSVIVPCSNAKYGCAEKVTYYQKEQHEKVCPNAPCLCPAPSCRFSGPAALLLDHLTTQHKCLSTTVTYSDMVSLRLLPGLHVLRCSGATCFFLVSMASKAFGHAISVVCVQPNVMEPKFTCHMSYTCSMTGYCENSYCVIKRSSPSDGPPTGYDFILPRGKVSDDRNGIMLRIAIHQHFSMSRSHLREKDTSFGLTTAFGYPDDDGVDDNNNGEQPTCFDGTCS